MACSRHVRLLLVILTASLFAGSLPARSVPSSPKVGQQPVTIVTVRWGARPGVTRYRLQLAQDSTFADVVFDRVVSGHEYRVSDLLPGKYFWRVAALGRKLGEFSSARVIEVRANGNNSRPPDASKNPNTNTIRVGGGWFAAIGNVTDPILARLRSPNALEVVGVNTAGRAFAIDALSGIALWNTRVGSSIGLAPAPVAIRTRAGLDNILVFSANVATMLEGRTGRELWRSALPATPSSAIGFNSKVFAIDNSLQKLFIVDGSDGKLVGTIQLPRRVAGPPALLETGLIVALDDGRIQIFDQNGKLTRSADAGSPATSSPVFLRSARGGLVLVGTKNGLTALNAADMRPLGRIALTNDAPRGNLSARDLEGDGIDEVVMFTDRGRVVVIKSDEGKILWEGDARQAGAVAFADVNKDRVLDLLLAGREGFAFSLSGRDGALLWEETASSGVATNQAPASAQRLPLSITSPGGVLLIAGDPNRGGLRAIEFSKAGAPQK